MYGPIRNSYNDSLVPIIIFTSRLGPANYTELALVFDGPLGDVETRPVLSSMRAEPNWSLGPFQMISFTFPAISFVLNLFIHRDSLFKLFESPNMSLGSDGYEFLRDFRLMVNSGLGGSADGD